ncbi:unnamed protein product [marine sediment metagenome]|uniref:Uncharacterized protein n=1 Tax=marine sediment metagenome TaxID=412755 RepID=X0T084_9ZZZZ
MIALRVNKIQAGPFEGPDKEMDQFEMTEISGTIGLRKGQSILFDNTRSKIRRGYIAF